MLIKVVDGDKEEQITAWAQRGQWKTCYIDLHLNFVVCRMLWSPCSRVEPWLTDVGAEHHLNEEQDLFDGDYCLKSVVLKKEQIQIIRWQDWVFHKSVHFVP